jgi:hypothetical protein
MVSETLPSRSLFSVDLRMSDNVESVDLCLPLGVMGGGRVGLVGGLRTGCGIRETPYTYPMVTEDRTTRLSLLATRAGLGGSGRVLLENALSCP